MALGITLLVVAALAGSASATTASKQPAVPSDRVVVEESGRAFEPDDGVYSTAVFDGRQQSMKWTEVIRTTADGGAGLNTESGCTVNWAASTRTNSLRVTASGIRCWGGAVLSRIWASHLDANVWIDVYPTRFLWRERRAETVNCTYNNAYCVSQTFTFTGHRIYRTSYVKAQTGSQLTTGESKSSSSQVYVYNNSGYPYPSVVDTRYSDGRAVAFRKPLYGWGKCEEEPTRRAPCDRGSTFRTRTITWYVANGRPLPSDPWEAHHITPIEFYGGNSVPSNAVALSAANHQVLTSWFVAFDLAQ
jgi:hypothetical protein